MKSGKHCETCKHFEKRPPTKYTTPAETEHTPTPYYPAPWVHDTKENVIRSGRPCNQYGEYTGPIIAIPVTDGATGKANAERAVLCVNSHDALVAALKSLLSRLSTECPGTVESYSAVKEACAALKSLDT